MESNRIELKILRVRIGVMRDGGKAMVRLLPEHSALVELVKLLV